MLWLDLSPVPQGCHLMRIDAVETSATGKGGYGEPTTACGLPVTGRPWSLGEVDTIFAAKEAGRLCALCLQVGEHWLEHGISMLAGPPQQVEWR